jgi:hypothetical protein
MEFGLPSDVEYVPREAREAEDKVTALTSEFADIKKSAEETKTRRKKLRQQSECEVKLKDELVDSSVISSGTSVHAPAPSDEIEQN